MRVVTENISEVPYHLRAARLRWAAFAVTLEDEEIEWAQSMVANAKTAAYLRAMAQLLLSLHHREEISKVCSELHFSRRRLLEFADRLTTKEGRRLLLSQPQAPRGRPRRVPL